MDLEMYLEEILDTRSAVLDYLENLNDEMEADDEEM